ncbi:hypothetical protein BTO02_28345 [Paraburkholderia sp. SOS3]|nr:hypothetical protein BTO02_28345 [Paraburkholderia sp. SOS3]
MNGLVSGTHSRGASNAVCERRKLSATSLHGPGSMPGGSRSSANAAPTVSKKECDLALPLLEQATERS